MTVVRAWYDPDAHALEIRLSANPVVRTAAVSDLHMVDLDADGQPVAIEILVPSDPRLEEIAARFDLEDRVPEIRAAIDAAMSPTCTSSGSVIFFFDEISYRATGVARMPLLDLLDQPFMSGSASAGLLRSDQAELVLSTDE